MGSNKSAATSPSAERLRALRNRSSDAVHLLYLLDKDRRPSRRPVVLAVVMLVLGLVCAVAGVVAIIVGGDEVFNLFFLGTILVVPGGYQCYVIIQSYRHKPGFDLHQVPVYDA